MTVTVTPNLTVLNECDDVTGFTASQGSPAVVTDIYREASGSIGVELRSSGVQWLKYTRSSGSWDLSNTHIYIWFQNLFFNALDIKSNGGIRILVGDGGDIGYWYVAGKDTYFGGWTCLVIDTSKAFDSGTCNLAAVTEVGIAVNYTKNVRNIESTYMDVARYGDGITVTSDAPCVPQDIFEYQDSDLDGRAYGIIRKEGGVFFLQGKLRLGSDSAGDIYFQASSQIIVFEDKDVNASLYEILVQGNGPGTTDVKFGEKMGDAGVSGCFIKSINPSLPFKFTATDPDIDVLGLYGCTFDTHGLIDLPPATVDREVLNCSFTNGMGQFQPNTIKVEVCNFISCDPAVDGYVLIESVSHGLKDCNFINNPNATEFESALTVTFDGLEFIGNTYDVNNTSGGTVNINVLNTINPPSTKTGDPTNITVSASHKLTGMKQYSEVTYVETGTENVLFNVEDVDETGETEYAYNATVEKTVDIHIHHVEYVPILLESILLGSAGGSIPITQRIDRVYRNP